MPRVVNWKVSLNLDINELSFVKTYFRSLCLLEHYAEYAEGNAMKHFLMGVKSAAIKLLLRHGTAFAKSFRS